MDTQNIVKGLIPTISLKLKTKKRIYLKQGVYCKTMLLVAVMAVFNSSFLSSNVHHIVYSINQCYVCKISNVILSSI
jgi:hypothetical protein